jgi:hypothetical protein
MESYDYPQQQSNIRAGAAWTLFLAQTLAASVEVFLHGRFGRRYLGIQAAAVLVAIPIYSVFWPNQNVDAMWLFLGAYAVMLMVAKAGILRRELRGDIEHSYYSGRPRLMPVFRHIGEEDTKRCWEPTLVALGGALLLSQNQPLAVYLIAAGVGLGIAEGIKHASRRNRTTDMNDAMFEQHNLMERVRGRRGR